MRKQLLLSVVAVSALGASAQALSPVPLPPCGYRVGRVLIPCPDPRPLPGPEPFPGPEPLPFPKPKPPKPLPYPEPESGPKPLSEVLFSLFDGVSGPAQGGAPVVLAGLGGDEEWPPQIPPDLKFHKTPDPKPTPAPEPKPDPKPEPKPDPKPEPKPEKPGTQHGT